ncbi:winged helix-turn-helix domain-containing protein [Granulicella arctica]|uniref:winged helix-turn-helix domain-containing protein n=1 Tax=Granulicella arctica TaxID=940613 RepID=UPI0021E0771A|nr:winged helix-turn-helix domain-containing protein [Granulicella arctica]
MASHGQKAQVVRFGPFELDLHTSLLERQGYQERLALQPTRLLALLVERRGELVTREELRTQLWAGETFVDFDHGLNNAVNRLREVLRDSASSPKYIQTVPRRGYRFIAEVEAKAAGNEGGEGLSAAERSIAVRAIEDASRDGSQAHLAEVLTEALMSALARVHTLRVFPESALSGPSRHATGKAGPDVLVGGSVLRVGNGVRITVRAMDSATRLEIWSQEYERDVSEILAVPKEVAATIAAEVRAEMTPQERQQLRATLTVRPEAYDCYLRGRFYAHRQNKDDNEISRLAFERAVEIDPTFAAAYAELAQAYVWKLFLFDPHERQWQEKAFVAVEKALSLDPYLAAAHLARGRLLWTPANRFPHGKAILEYRRALALDATLDEARNQLALIYCHIGYFDAALREAEEAVFTNPNNNLAVYRMAQTMVFQGKHEQALGLLQTIPPDVNPSLIGYQTAWILFNLGRNDEASRLIETLLGDSSEDDGALFMSMQGVLAASAGRVGEAKALIETAIETGKGFGHFHHAAYHIAVAFTLLSEPGDAVRWLEFAAKDGFPCYPLFVDDGNLENLHEDAGYVGLMAKLKGQWLEYGALF